jgi:2-polyprenyl-3-methyl-5-hydroxy-6-metoxy-1,4-benzoquinol methylase
VDQSPDQQTFALMYEKSTYHDCDYEGEIGGTYADSVEVLSKYATNGATILDYGCGLGEFIKILDDKGFVASGVEFDQDSVDFASKNSSCRVWSTDDFWKLSPKKKFDVIHLGDVLEHLYKPADTLNDILENMKTGGVLFVEGPLEINPSPVYWATKIYGQIKHIFRPNFIATDPPHHLFRVGEKQQLELFLRFKGSLKLKYWHVYESGWPYIEGGLIKVIIAKIAILIGGNKIINTTFGNRFHAIFIKS